MKTIPLTSTQFISHSYKDFAPTLDCDLHIVKEIVLSCYPSLFALFDSLNCHFLLPAHARL